MDTCPREHPIVRVLERRRVGFGRWGWRLGRRFRLHHMLVPERTGPLQPPGLDLGDPPPAFVFRAMMTPTKALAITVAGSTGRPPNAVVKIAVAGPAGAAGEPAGAVPHPHERGQRGRWLVTRRGQV